MQLARPDPEPEEGTEHMGCREHNPASHYEIAVEGELDAGWAASFSGMDIKLGSLGDRTISTLAGQVTDQAALRGMLCKLWDLNLTLVRVRRLEAPQLDQGGAYND
jgi:hypothetical protein